MESKLTPRTQAQIESWSEHHGNQLAMKELTEEHRVNRIQVPSSAAKAEAEKRAARSYGRNEIEKSRNRRQR
jgi:hypothetical protein